MAKFQVGDRVRISDDYDWAQGQFATVADAPESVVQLVEDQAPWFGCRRVVQGVRGPIEFIWVRFDAPQDDGSGDGPYAGGEIEADMLLHAQPSHSGDGYAPLKTLKLDPPDADR